MNNFITEKEGMAASIRKIKTEHPFYNSEVEVKDEPLSSDDEETFSEHHIKTDTPFCDLEYVVKEEEINEYTEYKSLEIQEEVIEENDFYDDRIEIPICENEIFIPHSNAVEIFKEGYQDPKIYSKSEESPYKCSDCDYTCASWSSFQCHLKTHKLDISYQCSRCDFSSVHLDSFAFHLRSYTVEKPFRCTECSFTTQDQRYWELHVRRHADEKPYKCTKCDYGTESPSYLKRHLWNHRVDFPHMCPVCNCRFLRLRDLQRHMWRHGDKMPFNCAECNYCTAYPSTFNRHLRKHADDKSFKCSKCSFCSTSNSELEAHMKEHIVDMPDIDSSVFKSRKKKMPNDDKDWCPNFKVKVTDLPNRVTRQGVCDPALGRILKESSKEGTIRPMFKAPRRRKKKPLEPQPCSSSSSSSLGEDLKIGKWKRRKTTTAKQRLAKILKIH